MAMKSLRVSPEKLEKVKRAFERTGLTQNEFASEVDLRTRQPIGNFLAGKPVKHQVFKEICFKLDLDWQEVADLSQDTQPETEQFQGTTSENPNFVGREDAIAHLNNLVNKGAKVILIQAEGGVGKTKLAKKWFERQGLKMLELSFPTMLEQLKSELHTQKIGFLINNLESSLINGQFIESHQIDYVELLKSLADTSVKSITFITSREPLHDDRLKSEDIKSYHLEGLKVDAWKDFFKINNINIDIDAISEINQAYGGNAEAMSLICADIKGEEFKGDLNAYWQKYKNDLLINAKLENLVKRQFDKLKRDNAQAYKLLCRLGCYRYQYISVISEKGVFCLLWDERNKGRFIRDLKNRALVKFSSEGYYLYEVIRQEAIERLKLTNDWKQCHAEAGIFLSTLISNNCQTIIPKINCTKVNDAQEQMYLNIESAETAVKQELTKQEIMALEVVYHAMEFYGSDSFEELRKDPKVLDNPFLKTIRNMVFEYVDCYSNLGIVLYQFALSTQVLAIIDDREGNFVASSKEFEYYQRSLKVSQCFFQTALLIATRVKEDKLMINLLRSLAECQDYTGIFIHQITKINESKEAFDQIKVNLEKAVQIFDKLSFEQQIDEVKQAIHSLKTNEEYYTTFIATFLT
ncbi:hypothetical protein CDG76_17285 [Nostoc sp. 'Peltigera membranacea cyanobiont' 210A]|uniref:ATP-binding protein n=1 Tax=Nostoc sp. 'Peltigera membranacea cyanobiont' 210A TaxID=2014529 RepID=UPI000B956070|nr:ATP-binding protein [Nostoc sp. 'Peltigera membranacea cyanobiont' 210A]OYD93737.1 hypothetical protein CDG76_17285 [Nostoc sp. 'Peltigera membranacea cyanobiont' 210A]